MKEPLKVAGWTIADDLSGDVFEDVALSLVDLHRVRLRRGEQVLRGLTFNRCRIEGPAVMLVLGGCNFDAVNFGAAKGVETLILRPESKVGVVGAIPVVDCKFVGSHMFSIGFTGQDAFLNQILAIEGKGPQ